METNEILDFVTTWLDEKKAENIVTIDLKGQGAIVDYMVIASATSNRHVNALAGFVSMELKNRGVKTHVEGVPLCDWVLLDIGDILVHLFRPEIRDFYNLEKMWGTKFTRDADGSIQLASA